MRRDVSDRWPFDPRADVVPSDGGPCTVVGGVEPVAVFGCQVDASDKRHPVVDHDRLLVVAVQRDARANPGHSECSCRGTAPHACSRTARREGRKTGSGAPPRREHAHRPAPPTPPADSEGPSECHRGGAQTTAQTASRQATHATVRLRSRPRFAVGPLPHRPRPQANSHRAEADHTLPTTRLEDQRSTPSHPPEPTTMVPHHTPRHRLTQLCIRRANDVSNRSDPRTHLHAGFAAAPTDSSSGRSERS